MFSWLRFLFGFNIKIFFSKSIKKVAETLGKRESSKLEGLVRLYKTLVNRREVHFLEQIFKQLVHSVNRKVQKNFIKNLKVETQLFSRKYLKGFRYLEKGKLSWKALSRKKKNMTLFGRSRLVDMSLLSMSFEAEIPNLTGALSCRSNFFFFLFYFFVYVEFLAIFKFFLLKK